MDPNNFNYNYFILNAELDFKEIKFNFNYNFYDSDHTYLNQFLKSEFLYSPIIMDFKYRPFVKFINTYIDLNNNYDINVENINLFESNSEDNSIVTSNNINYMTFEIGFIFDSFRISYKKMNPLESSVIITENKLEFIQYDYIDLVWLFKD